ncbi:uncharacterized protein TRAVEDRAFT_83878, partial [Trametes versicolor FP-101664 SS1]|uniref:uncharacterized protein n=1 Tax=Trametes versicolor (strain FP-101664) TaxID=717944 RepID=UPI00046216DA
PLPGRFGVMQIDPVAMVEHLEDEDALAPAKAIQTKRYIGYLRDTIELPWPQRPWYGYNVLPIATTLRPEDPERAISAEMCIPIAPNTNHPTNRPSLPTEPSFPFSNCYYWVESHTNVRI